MVRRSSLVARRPRESRHAEIDAILEAKAGGVSETRDEADNYMPEADPDPWTVSLTGAAEGAISMTA